MADKGSKNGGSTWIAKVIGLHWLAGAVSFVLSSYSWKLVAIGASCWLLSALVFIGYMNSGTGGE